MYNTIILLKATESLTLSQFKRNYSCGDAIFSSLAEELDRWSIEDKDIAVAELAKHKCTYDVRYCVDITEYALEYCECDDNGVFIQGSDYDFADVLEEGDDIC